MTSTLFKGDNYFFKAWDSKQMRRFALELSEWVSEEFALDIAEDVSLVATGISGAMALGQMRLLTGAQVAYVRKEDDESTHSSNMVEGIVMERFIFVDDFISSGDTMKHALTRVWQHACPAKFIGTAQYDNWGRFSFHRGTSAGSHAFRAVSGAAAATNPTNQKDSS